MNIRKPLLFLCMVLALALAGCKNNPPRADAQAAVSSGQRALFDGEYDNHEQVVRADTADVTPVRIRISPLSKAGWYVWTVDFSGSSPLSARWLMRSFKSVNGSLTLTPYRAPTDAVASEKEIDPDSWIALDACSLHGSATADGLDVKADLASCTTLAPGIGASAALLPIDIHHDGERLDVRLYADQARGPDAKVEARRVRWFEGWAALHGGGRSGDASSKDWHMNRELRLGSEGGRMALKWRDGQSSGYSLMLERATYRDGNVPVLKLSVLEDATGSTISYAWANPEASRIGISLGWIQVGLSLSAHQENP
ncbi:MAG: hypothetical protein E6Q43_05600 [Dokdonella sp.]|nr:MAG: hypothetical protein E6Q43_05600 [Dokdonella sp.]